MSIENTNNQLAYSMQFNAYLNLKEKFYKGDYAEVAYDAEILETITDHPSLTERLLYLAQESYARTNNANKTILIARKYFDNVGEIPPLSEFTIRENTAKGWLLLNRPDHALSELNQCFKIANTHKLNPKNLHLKLVGVYRQKKELEKTSNQILKTIPYLIPSDNAAHQLEELLMTSFANKTNEWEIKDTFELAKDCSAISTTDESLLGELARIFLELKDLNAANILFSLLGNLAHLKNDHQAALFWFEKMNDGEYATSPGYVNGILRLKLALGEYEEAITFAGHHINLLYEKDSTSLSHRQHLLKTLSSTYRELLQRNVEINTSIAREQLQEGINFLSFYQYPLEDIAPFLKHLMAMPVEQKDVEFFVKHKSSILNATYSLSDLSKKTDLLLHFADCLGLGNQRNLAGDIYAVATRFAVEIPSMLPKCLYHYAYFCFTIENYQLANFLCNQGTKIQGDYHQRFLELKNNVDLRLDRKPALKLQYWQKQ